MKKRVCVMLEVEVDVRNPDVIARTQTDDWRSQFYTLTQADVWCMLAYNHVANGVTNVGALDGWGDLGREDVHFVILDDETEMVE